jgi:tellurite resistance protein TerC
MPLPFWIGFNVLILLLLFLDLGLHRKAHDIGVREALGWSAFWIALALAFGAWINFSKAPGLGHEAALRFVTGYLIEKSLSVDNLFVFVLIFGYFKVEPKYQHSVLFWGILGALVMRAVFIFAGVALLNRFHWVIYVFGIFLIFTGLRMVGGEEKEMDPGRNPVQMLIRRFFRVWPEFVGGSYLVRRDGKWWLTPLMVTLIVVEVTDLVFAVDSIPAILSITPDPFIVYTSNVFAILGLRSLYFALAALIGWFHLLRYGLAAILIFIGLKMTFSNWVHLHPSIALGVVAVILLLSIFASIRFPRKPEAGAPPPAA